MTDRAITLNDADLRAAVERFTPQESLNVWQWAAREVAFARPYASMYEGPYDPDMTPCWKEPMEAFTDRTVREIWILKCSQGGGSENTILMPMRYCVARRPCSVIYIGGQMEGVEAFIRERIKPGLRLSDQLRRRWATAQELEHSIYYPDMLIACGWCTNDDIFEMRPGDVVFCDEFDKWGSYAPDKIRSRVRTRANSKIVGVSSIYLHAAGQRRNASRHPILEEIRQTDQRYVWVPEPEQRNKRTRGWFKFEFGWRDKRSGQESPYGLKWSQDARGPDDRWDLKAVRESAHYVTPAGACVDDAMRADLLEHHEWRPSVFGRDVSVRGYIHPCFNLPFDSFGDIAVRWLKAVAKKNDEGNVEPLRVYIARDLCEEPQDEVQHLQDEEIERRQGQYAKGNRMSQSDGVCDDAGTTFKTFYVGKSTRVILTADVQKHELYWLAREWVIGGDSGLLDWGMCVPWEDLDAKASKTRGVGASHVLVDAGYGERTQEVYEACWKYRFIPTMGKDNITDLLFVEGRINPFEGTKRGGKRHQIGIIYFRTDAFKTQLMRRVNGTGDHRWWTYHGTELEYVLQMSSEQRTEDGQWEFRPGRARRNHLWDCEVLQLVAATRFGFNRFKGFEARAEKGGETEGKPS